MIDDKKLSNGCAFYIIITVCILFLVSISHGFHDRVGTNNSSYDPDALANRLEKEYDINIMWKGRGEYTRFNNSNVKATLTDKRMNSYLTLQKMEVILKRLPKGIFTEIKNNDSVKYYEGNRRKYSYIDIYFCNSINVDGGYDIRGGYTAGLTGGYDDRSGLFIMLDISYPAHMNNTFAHELFHMFEWGIRDEYYNHRNGSSGVDFYKAWLDSNPAGYKYISETMSGNFNIYDIDLSYGIETEDKDHIFFVSKYAQASIQEDMAETFTHLLTDKGGNMMPKAYRSSHVQRKAKLLIDMLDRTYSTINKDAYWNRIYDELVEAY